MEATKGLLVSNHDITVKHLAPRDLLSKYTRNIYFYVSSRSGVGAIIIRNFIIKSYKEYVYSKRQSIEQNTLIDMSIKTTEVGWGSLAKP